MHNAAGRYAGSKISLITTSDVRYEGVLCTLNAEETALSVQGVRSFGTEGRKTPEVPKSNEIYDFILFRNKDLKMVTILEDNGEKMLEFAVSLDPPGAFSPLTRGNGNPSLTDTTDDSGPSSASSGSLLTPLFPSDGNSAPLGGGLGFGTYPGTTDFLHPPVDLPPIQNIQPHHPAAHLMFSPQQMQQRHLLSQQDTTSSGNPISLNAVGTQHDLTNPSSWVSGHSGHNSTITSHKMAEPPFGFSSGSTHAYANNSSTQTNVHHNNQNNAIGTFALDANAPNYVPMAHCTQPTPVELTGTHGNGHYTASNEHYNATNDHANHNGNFLLFQHRNAYNGASSSLSAFPHANTSLAVGMNGNFGQPSMSNGGSTATCGPIGAGHTAGNAFGLSVGGALSMANGNAFSTGNGNAFSSTVGFDCAASLREEWESGAFAREVQKLQNQSSHSLSTTQISLGNSLWRSHSAPESPVVNKERDQQVGKPLGSNDRRRYSDDDRVEEKQPPPHPPVSLCVETMQQSRETPAQAPTQANRRNNNRNAQRDAQIASNARPNGHTTHSTNARGNSATHPTTNSAQNNSNGSTANGRNNTKDAFQATKQPKTIKDVFQLHKQAEEVLLDAARSRGPQSLSSRELRQLSESHSCVYHFFLDFVNYCRHGPSLSSTHWASSDEQHWEQCSRGLKKYFESEGGVKAHRMDNSNAASNRFQQHHEKKDVGAGRGFTLGDFTVEKSKKATRNNKRDAKTAVTNAIDTVSKVSSSNSKTALPQKKALTAKSEPHEPPVVSKAPPARARAKAAVTPPVKVVESGPQSWSCPRCTLSNVETDFNCGACGCTRDYANFVVDFPPLR